MTQDEIREIILDFTFVMWHLGMNDDPMIDRSAMNDAFDRWETF